MRAVIEPLEDRLLMAVVHFVVDPQQDRQPISRLIYGVNESLDDSYSNATFRRAGGNRWTAYNWENNASNAGSDWQYQNDGYLGGGATPGGAVTGLLADTSAHNAGSLLTIPINGYVSADKNGGGDVRNSGANYLQTRFRQEVARKGSAFSLTPDVGDAFVYQDEFVHWVKTNYAYSQTDPNRPIHFELDNEPDLWSSTHAEVHPNPATYAELVQKTIAYASAIKDVAPASLVFGPANYGWQGYIRLQNAPDAAGRDFQSFYLQQLAQAEQTAGKRLVDVLDVHWYPEAKGGGVRITTSESTAAIVAARLQAPRSLWDATYTETSWIAQDSLAGPVNLLPRLQSKIDANYPGTLLAITEYNYGGGAHISGGIAQADVLGIFGRDGVFAANQWPLAADESFIGAGFEMFRNFDGNHGSFGDVSILATTDDVAASSIYASVDSTNPNWITLVAINKTSQPLTSTMNLHQVAPGATASIYQLTGTSANPTAAGNLNIADPANFAYTLPAYSVSTIRIVNPTASVVDRRVFYNQSAFDANNAAANAADDGAIASGKVALRPGQLASAANYTSYSRGLNGVLVDIAGLPAGNVTAADFTFRTGNNNTPGGWAAAPAPSSITVRRGAGLGGSDRVSLVWTDNAIAGAWLQVTVKANANTGLQAADVFYFGNAIGESGNSAGNAQVNSTDEIAARANPKTFSNLASIADAYDFNRDRLVNATDQILARSHATTLAGALQLITVPAVLDSSIHGASSPTDRAADIAAAVASGSTTTQTPITAIRSQAMPVMSPGGRGPLPAAYAPYLMQALDRLPARLREIALGPPDEELFELVARSQLE